MPNKNAVEAVTVNFLGWSGASGYPSNPGDQLVNWGFRISQKLSFYKPSFHIPQISGSL